MSRPGPPAGPFLVAGLGIAGLSAARALAERHGAGEVAAWGHAVAGVHREQLYDLGRCGVDVRVGGDGTDLLDGRQVVVKSPGIPDDAPLMATAARLGLTVIDEAELGWRLDDRPLVGVTGTNGKSTVCALIAAVLADAGRTPIVAGNNEGGPALTSLSREREPEVVVAELSSFQLRHSPSLLPDVAVLTNCTHDSWHRHEGRAGYERDKSRIALRGDTPAPHSILPADDPLGRRLAASVEDRNGRATTFGMAADAGCRVEACEWTLDGATLTIAVAGARHRIDTRLPGTHNALNVAASLAAANAMRIALETAADAIARAAPVPGRLERIPTDAPFDVLVDYAHNPDGLAQVLATVRAVLRQRGAGRLIAVASALPVFDDDQYAAMGRALAAGADLVVATTERLSADAPPEEPPAFFAALRQGAAELAVEIDRRVAVELAIDRATAGDVILVLGRGRRRTPIHVPGGEPIAIDDRDHARAVLAARDR